MAGKAKRSQVKTAENSEALFWRWMEFHYSARQAILLTILPMLLVFYIAGYRATTEALDMFLAASSILTMLPTMLAYMSARNVNRIFLRQPTWPSEFMESFEAKFERDNQFPAQLVTFLAKKRATRAQAVVTLEQASLWFGRHALSLLVVSMLLALVSTAFRLTLRS